MHTYIHTHTHAHMSNICYVNIVLIIFLFYIIEHGFDIILYGVQLASDKVNFLAYLVASSVEQLTNIRVSIRSFQFT